MQGDVREEALGGCGLCGEVLEAVSCSVVAEDKWRAESECEDWWWGGRDCQEEVCRRWRKGFICDGMGGRGAGWNEVV